jgi:hypothetical protein
VLLEHLRRELKEQQGDEPMDSALRSVHAVLRVRVLYLDEGWARSRASSPVAAACPGRRLAGACRVEDAAVQLPGPSPEQNVLGVEGPPHRGSGHRLKAPTAHTMKGVTRVCCSLPSSTSDGRLGNEDVDRQGSG